LSAVEQGQVSDVQITDQKIILGTMRSVNGSPVQQSRFQTVIPYTDTDLIAFLETKGVHISGKLSKPSLLTDVFSLLPLVLTVVLIFVFMRQMSMQNTRGMQFGKSRARLFDNNKEKITFADVAGQEEPKKELSEITGSKDRAAEILSYTEGAGDFSATLKKIEAMAGGKEADSERMRDIYEMLEAAGIEKNYTLDPSITRGLDYYTGVVYETFLNDLPEIGSVCSGGRYDNLAGLYMKEKLPGVGTSIGLDRLIAAMSELGITSSRASYVDAEIFCLDAKDALLYQKAAASLRAQGLAVEVFPDAKKIAQQYALTDAKKIPWGIFVGKTYEKDGTFELKNLSTRELSAGITVSEAAKLILNKK